LRAQDNGESPRMREILKPDPNRQFDLRQGSLNPKTFQSGSSTVQTDKTFGFLQRFRSKSYDTKSFQGGKDFWMGDFKFSTKDAPTKGRNEIPNLQREVPTSKFAARTLPEAEKQAPTRPLPDGQRTFLGKENDKLRVEVDQLRLPRSNNDLRELKTIEDVRELLNKNR
jgi:hypothetical protein